MSEILLRSSNFEEVTFRGPSSSVQYNEFQKSLFMDLNNLFELTGKSKLDLIDKLGTIYHENIALQRMVKQLENQITLLQSNMALTNERIHGAFFFTNENIPNTIIPLFGPDVSNDLSLYQPLYGEITLPILNRTSKVHLIANELTGEVSVPRELEVSFEFNQVQDLVVLDQGDIFKAFNGKAGEYWKFTALSPSGGVNSVEGTIHIKLPTNISANIFVDTIFIHSFPEYTMEIINITYKTIMGETFSLQNLLTNTTLQNSPLVDHLNPTVPFYNIGKQIYRFKREEITEIDITIRQPVFYKNAGEQSNYFIFGAQEIGVEYTTYASAGDIYILFPDAPATSLGNLGYRSLNQQFGKVFFSTQTVSGDPLPDNIVRISLEQGINNPSITPVVSRIEYREQI